MRTNMCKLIDSQAGKITVLPLILVCSIGILAGFGLSKFSNPAPEIPQESITNHNGSSSRPSEINPQHMKKIGNTSSSGSSLPEIAINSPNQNVEKITDTVESNKTFESMASIPGNIKSSELLRAQPRNVYIESRNYDYLRSSITSDSYGQFHEINSINCQGEMCELKVHSKLAPKDAMNLPDADWQLVLNRMRDQTWWRESFTEETFSMSNDEEGKFHYVMYLSRKPFKELSVDN